MTIDDLATLIKSEFNRMDDRFDKIDARFEQVDASISDLKHQIGFLSMRISALEERLTRLEVKIDEIKKMTVEDVLALGEDIERERRRIDKLEGLYKKLAQSKGMV